MAASVDRFSDDQLELLARELAEAATRAGLDALLRHAGLPASGVPTKWRRLLDSFERQQGHDGHGSSVARFIQLTMDPARFDDGTAFEDRRQALNEILAADGLVLRSDGRLARLAAVAPATDAQERADRLRAKLQARGAHPDVLALCRPDLTEESYFHAVLEATESVARKIRTRTGLNAYGVDLVDSAFGTRPGMPMLAFNQLRTDAEKGEQAGLATLIEGMFATLRSRTDEGAGAQWAVEEGDALDLLTVASLAHRRLDAASITPRAPAWHESNTAF